ncbi:MAG: glycosyltransferase family 4 protein [Lachnospiraceae bacterium]|nr:glycosyltransferase family 4 protein [Lachnospiraceae bacterium]
MKILILTNHDGALYRFRADLLRALVKEHEVFASFPRGDMTEEIRALGCRVICCDALERRGKNPLNDLKLFLHYRKLLRQIRPDAVLTYTVKPNIYGGWNCRLARIPYLAGVTGLGSVFEGRGLSVRILRAFVVRMYRSALKGCSCLFFQNSYSMKAFADLGIRAKKARLVSGSGVDLDFFREAPMPAGGDGRSGDPVQFLMIGRVMKEKGLEEYLLAAARIKKKYPATVFHLCGYREPGYRGRLDAAIEKQIVNYHGEINGMRDFLRGVHCVVLPSYSEGMSNALLEGSATGRAVITTDRPGCREAAEDGVTGYLVPVRDAEALEKAMERFLALTQEERAAMGHRARLKMEREFDRRKVTAAYLTELARATRA